MPQNRRVGDYDDWDDVKPEGGTEAGVVARLAREAGEPQTISDGKAVGVLVPEGASLDVRDLERYANEPRRKRGTVRLHDPASFASYVNAHADSGTAVYADARGGVVTAVLNGHEPEREGGAVPGWGDHRAVLALRHSHEWLTWINRDGKLTEQVEFAQFVEDNYADIVEPDHATMLEIASSMDATSSAAFKSRQRLADGQVQFAYEETIQAKAGQRGDLKIPEVFTVALRVFDGIDPVLIRARLRYRISGGGLSIGYRLERLPTVQESAFDGVVHVVDAELDGGACLRAAAPEPVSAG